MKTPVRARSRDVYDQSLLRRLTSAKSAGLETLRASRVNAATDPVATAPGSDALLTLRVPTAAPQRALIEAFS